MFSSSRASGNRQAASLADAKADARRVIERLGGQVLNLTGTDPASQQALADASGDSPPRPPRSSRPRRPNRRCWPRRARSRGCTTCGPRAPRWAWTRARSWRPSPDRSPRARSPGPPLSSSRTRDRGFPVPSPNTRTTTRAAGWPDARCRRAGTRTVVEVGAAHRRLDHGLGAVVRRDVLRDTRRGVRGVGLRERLRSGFDQGFDAGYDQGLDAAGGGDGGWSDGGGGFDGGSGGGWDGGGGGWDGGGRFDGGGGFDGGGFGDWRVRLLTLAGSGLTGLTGRGTRTGFALPSRR